MTWPIVVGITIGLLIFGFFIGLIAWAYRGYGDEDDDDTSSMGFGST